MKSSLYVLGFFIATGALFWFLSTPNTPSVTQQQSVVTSKEKCTQGLSEKGVGGDYYCDSNGIVQKELTNQEIRDAQTEAKATCNIKGNISFNSGEKIYHVPGQKYYDSTNIDTAYGERMFCSEQAALNAGWRKAYE